MIWVMIAIFAIAAWVCAGLLTVYLDSKKQDPAFDLYDSFAVFAVIAFWPAWVVVSMGRAMQRRGTRDGRAQRGTNTQGTR